MNLVGKKTQVTDTKKIFTNASLRKQQKQQHTQVCLCFYTKYYSKGTVHSSVKAKAATSGQGVDNNLA